MAVTSLGYLLSLLGGSVSTYPDALRKPYIFGRAAAVPGAGTLQLFLPDVVTVGIRMLRPWKLTGLSVQVNVVDGGGRTYDLQIRKNGVAAPIATLALPAATIGASTAALAVTGVAGDYLQAFMVRTAGAGASTFVQIASEMELTV
jgi:hypothetical protein